MDKDVAEDRSAIYDDLLKDILRFDRAAVTERMSRINLFIQDQTLPKFDKVVTALTEQVDRKRVFLPHAKESGIGNARTLKEYLAELQILAGYLKKVRFQIDLFERKKDPGGNGYVYAPYADDDTRAFSRRALEVNMRISYGLLFLSEIVAANKLDLLIPSGELDGTDIDAYVQDRLVFD